MLNQNNNINKSDNFCHKMYMLWRSISQPPDAEAIVH